MAGIEATIRLNDGVSSTLSSIEKSLGKLVSTLDSINAKFDKLIDPNAFTASKAAIDGVNKELAQQALLNDRLANSATRRAAVELAADERVSKMADARAYNDLKNTERLINLEEDRVKKTQVNNDAVIASATRRAKIELAADEQLRQIEEKNAAADLKRMDNLETVTLRNANARAVSAENTAARLIAADNRVDQIAENNALKDIERTEKLTAIEENGVVRKIQNENKIANSIDSRATKELLLENQLAMAEDKRVANTLQLEEKLGITQDKRAHNALTYEQKLSALQEANASRAAINSEREIQAIERSTQARQKTQQEINKTAVSAGKVVEQENKVKKSVEDANNARLRGVNIELQIENTKKRGATLDKAAADREARKLNQINKQIQAATQEYAIKKMIESTQARYAGGIERVNQKYSEAKQRVIELERSVDRTNKLEMLQLQSAKQICSQRQKLVDLTDRLVQTRIKLNTLEIQGKNHGIQAFIQRRKEASIKRDIANTSRQILSIERQTKAAIEGNVVAQNNFNNAKKNAVSSANSFVGKLKGVAAAYLGVQTAGSIIKTADSLAANEARLKLMVKEGESVDQLSNQIYEAAMRSRSGYLQMADSVAKVGIQAGNLFNNSGDMVRFMETFNKMGVISKATSQQTNAAMTQLIQALSFGQLRGDELKSILENMPMVAHALADELTRTGQTLGGLPNKLRHIAADGKVTADEIRELGYEGQISAETVVNAMLNGAAKIDKMAKNMSWTWGQVWEVFKNASIKAFTPVLNGITKIISTKRFQRFADWVGKMLERVGRAATNLYNVVSPILAKIFDAIASIGNFISNNWDFAIPIIWGIVAAFVAYKTAVMGVTIWNGICAAATAALTFAKTVQAASTAMATGATFAQTAAQYGLNAALLACPLTWIILLIIAVIVVIYLAVAAVNHFAGTSISATGLICAYFSMLYAHVCNIFSYMWNVVASWIEFFVNVWSNPMYSVKRLFVNLATNVIDCLIAMTKGCDKFATAFVNAILWAVNKAIEGWNAFVDILPDSIASKLGLGKGNLIEARASFTSDLESAKASLQGLLGDKPSDYWEAPKMEFKNLGEYAMKGYNWGASKADKVSNLMSGKDLQSLVDMVNGTGNKSSLGKAIGGDYYDDPASKVSDPSANVKNPALDKLGKGVGDIGKNTGETADNTSSLNDQEAEFLRQIAEMEAINRYTLTDLKVEMNNSNSISSNMDIDDVMRQLGRALYKAVKNNVEAALP